MTVSCQEVSFSPPLPSLPGDEIRLVGGVVQLVRSGVVVATRTANLTSAITPGVVNVARTVSSLFVVKEVLMPGTNVALTGVTVGANDSVTAKFSDGTNSEYADWESLKADVEPLDSDGKLNRDLLLLLTVRRSPDGANKTNMVGGSVSINCEADTPVTVTYPAQ